MNKLNKNYSAEPRSPSELALQARIFIRAWNTYPTTRGCLWRVRNEEPPRRGETKSQYARRLAQGLATGILPGASDLMLLWGGQLYCFELKLPNGKQSDKQDWFEGQVEAQGAKYFLITTEEQFFEVFEAIVLAGPMPPL